METTSILRLQNLSKKYKHRYVLRNVSAEFRQPGIYLILGPNGAGKTTLLKIIAGLLHPDTGQVHYGPPFDEPDSFRYLAFLSHESFCYDNLTPKENLEFYGTLYDVSDKKERIKALLEDVDLLEATHKPVGSFSKGMIQRLALARVMLQEPKLLLMDEPFNGLDVNGIDFLLSKLVYLVEQGTTILMITHDLKLDIPGLNRFIVLIDGRLEADIPADAAGLEHVKTIMKKD